MKKLLSLLTLSTTLTAGAIGISSCGFGSKKVSNNYENTVSEVKKPEKEETYTPYNIDIDYDEIFYTPTFAIENEEGEWEPYKNEKYDNKLFFYSTVDGETRDSEKVIYDNKFGFGFYYPQKREEIDFFQSIVNSVRLHEIYLANKKLFNNFEFIERDEDQIFNIHDPSKDQDDQEDIYSSITYPKTGKFVDLEGDWLRGDYHLNIKHNNLNCTINSKTTNTELGEGVKLYNLNLFSKGAWTGTNRLENWTFSADPEECKWFSDDLKERFVFVKAEEISFRIIDDRLSSYNKSVADISILKKILNKDPIKTKLEENGTVYDEWFRGANRERIIEKDFWTTLDKNFDTDIFSPQEKVNPRNIVYAKGHMPYSAFANIMGI